MIYVYNVIQVVFLINKTKSINIRKHLFLVKRWVGKFNRSMFKLSKDIGLDIFIHICRHKYFIISMLYH